MKQINSTTISLILTVLIFVLDLYTPLGYSTWLLYAIPLLIVSSTAKRSVVSLFGFAITVLVIADLHLSPPGVEPSIAIVNRSLGISALWTLSFLNSRRKKTEVALRRAYEELEQRVRERTADLGKLTHELRAEIEERKNSETALRKSEEELSRITANIAEGIYVFDENGRVIFMNPEAERLLGYTFDEVNEKGPHNLVHFRKADGAPLPLGECNMHRVIKTGRRFASTDEVFVRKDGTVFPISVISSPIIENSRVVASITAFRDITDLKKAEEEIRHIALHDSLTGLPNRRSFNDILKLELAQARRHNSKLAVLFLDLDRFKEINDTLGHDIGDRLLKEVAARLRKTIRESDTIARIGGDEFNVVLADIARPEYVSEIALKIVNVLREPVVLDLNELNITTSVGISIYPDDSRHIDTLLRYSDRAMYNAKESGRNTYRFYNPSMNASSMARAKLEHRLRQTIKRGELSVRYQSQIDIKSKKIISAEAFVRWSHPERGLLEPGEFMPLAEETGFVASIDEWVLRTVCTQARAWRDKGLGPLCVTVNLSARLFQAPRLTEIVSSILRETGLPPGCLDIEITESTAMSDVERSASQLRELRGIGVHISIDDFGTGYSSLNYLKKLPIERLKIDNSFIHDITTDQDDRDIINAINSMAHQMGILTVAEGVETEEQLEFLRKSECDEAQGFLFSKPVPAEEFRELLMHSA